LSEAVEQVIRCLFVKRPFYNYSNQMQKPEEGRGADETPATATKRTKRPISD